MRFRGLVMVSLGFMALAGGAPARVLQGFEQAGGGSGTVWVNPAVQASATRWSVEVTREGWEGGHALRVSMPAGSSDSVVWGFLQHLDLGVTDGLSIRLRASRPLNHIRVAVHGGDGMLYAEAMATTSWSESTWRFEECFGLRRFDRRRITGIFVDPFDELSEPLVVWIDQISAFKDPPGTPVRRSLRLMEIHRDTWLQPVLNILLTSNTLATGLEDRGARLSYFTTDEAYVDGRRIFYMWQLLPHDLSGCTGLRLVLSSSPREPKVILKFMLTEAGGEQFETLRDAPLDRQELYLPFADFVPDAASNKNAAAASRNNLLDLGAVDTFGIEIIPLTEEPVRGAIDIGEAWAVRK